jgi:hypothetical protein
MRPKDVRSLIQFNTRMANFICPSNRANIVAFLHGYEHGTGGACRFLDALSDCLATRHRVKLDSLGWPHQMALYAERLSLDWIDAYLLVSSEVLQKALESKSHGAKRKSVG